MLPPRFTRYRLDLRLLHSARLHFRHEVMLHSLLSESLGRGELPENVVPFACESGRVAFERDETYRIAFTVCEAPASDPRPATNDQRTTEFAEHAARALGVYGARGFQGERIPMLRWFRAGAAERLPPPDLDAMCAALAGRDSLRLHFVSPLRLEIPRGTASEARESRGGRGAPRQFFDASHFPAADFLRLLWNRIHFLTMGRFPHREEAEAGLPPIPALTADPRHLLWIDVPRATKPSLGGALGAVTLANPGPAWLPLLVAGQYLHVGKSCGYGFGAYRIATDLPASSVKKQTDSVEREGKAEGRKGPPPEQRVSFQPSSPPAFGSDPGSTSRAMPHAPLHDDPFGPSRTALELVADRERLSAAASHVAAATEAGGTDGIGPAEFVQRQEETVTTVIRALADGTYRPAPLLGILLPRGHHKVRALAVPTLTDRAVQRAALEVLGPAIETLLEDCSYAYRKGLSRAGAARAIERAYAEGYRWVLDADIDSFFDAVDWERLFGKLEALYPFDPIVALLKAWVTAPVVFEGMRIDRTRGLPQGAVLSPLLANLYLDELDEELLGNDYRLVRYADDFVVLCKDLAAAERARDEARNVLARLGLALQEEKTSIRSADHGFSYLGYLFCRSVTVPQEKEEEPPQPHPAEPLTVSPYSWLAHADLSTIRELGEPAKDSATAAAGTADAPIVPLREGAAAPSADPRRPLYVTGPDVRLYLHDGTLSAEKENEPAKRIPLRALSHVVFLGSRRATLPLILELGLAGIPSYFCHRNGELEAVHGPFEADPAAWIAQGKAAESEEVRLAFAQEIVAAKLHNYATLSVRHSLRGAEAAAREIRELERSVWNKTEVDSVRGAEGAGAAVYFRCVGETLDGGWDFTGRIRHPPRDPFNALLSYGYTLLHHHCATSLYAAGLLPRIGLFHREHGAWQALASDLQEEFRHVGDGVVWSLVKRREITPQDFERNAGGCWLQPEPRKRFLEAFEGRMETAFTPQGTERAMTYREAVGLQAVRLREHLLGRARYEAVRAHS